MIVTIDGPAGTGKSTIAKKIAAALSFTYVDTGAMYRSVTYGILKAGIADDDATAISTYLDTFDLEIRAGTGKYHYLLEGEDITDAIRSKEVTHHVSAVSALPTVREHLVAIQRRLASGSDVVLEGRDVGTVVFPDAEVKIFLTARPEVRALRRIEQTHAGKWTEEELQQVLEDINRRDKYDSEREHSPLKPADDAIRVDTSDLDIDGVVAAVLDVIPK